MHYTTKQKKNIADLIGTNYRTCMRKIDSARMGGHVVWTDDDYRDCEEYVRTIERVLQDCSCETRFIIRNGILQIPEPGWYEEVYSKNTFYRLRKKAIEEFLNCLKR